jgi:hypothetical protein
MREFIAALGLGGLLVGLGAGQGVAAPFSFDTGPPTNQIATATRPSNASKFEIESADDFILTQSTRLTSATFTGLISGTSTLSDINNVVVEIYRVFPALSDVGRTSGPPTFSTPQVPTRVNSPSDVALESRDSTGGSLSFSGSVLANFFTASNSVQPGGIHPKPGQTTGGNGSITGTEVQFSVNFLTPFDLPADHYFFVPQVGLSTSDNFFWLSGQRPTIPPFTPDLQSWTRDQFLDPDWLRIGTDIVGAGTFNATFSLAGETNIPEPISVALFASALAALGFWRGRLAR